MVAQTAGGSRKEEILSDSFSSWWLSSISMPAQGQGVSTKVCGELQFCSRLQQSRAVDKDQQLASVSVHLPVAT